MTHEEIVAALHAAHLAHLGEDPEIVEDCAPCSVYAEWVAPLLVGAWDTGVKTAGASLLGLHEHGHWEMPVNPYALEGR